MTLMLLAAILYSLGCVGALAQTPSAAQGANREAKIERLRQVIRDKEIQAQDPKQVVKAMLRLGELKAVEAIEDLIALLAFKYPKESRHGGLGIGGGAFDGYGAKSALAKIGKPALPALVTVIATAESSSLESKNARGTVFSIFSGRLPEGVKYLRDQASRADSPIARERLTAAAQHIEDFVAKWYPPDKRP